MDLIFSNAQIMTAANVITREQIRAVIAGGALPECININAIQVFNATCTDPALLECVNLEYDYYNHAPDNTKAVVLYKKIEELIPQIKDAHIQKYFKTKIEFINTRHAMKKRNAHNIDDYEDKIDELLYKITLEGKNDIFTQGPLFHWYVLKQTEARILKMISLGHEIGGLHARFK